jgi:hypothetical protein
LLLVSYTRGDAMQAINSCINELKSSKHSSMN